MSRLRLRLRGDHFINYWCIIIHLSDLLLACFTNSSTRRSRSCRQKSLPRFHPWWLSLFFSNFLEKKIRKEKKKKVTLIMIHDSFWIWASLSFAHIIRGLLSLLNAFLRNLVGLFFFYFLIIYLEQFIWFHLIYLFYIQYYIFYFFNICFCSINVFN